MFGVFRIVEEFPDVQVIAHPFTRAATLGRPMDYLKKQPTVMDRYIPKITERLEKPEASGDTRTYHPQELESYRYIIKHQDLLDSQFKTHDSTLPTITFENKLVIYSGSKEVQLLHIGDANTEGDIIMWLPQDKIVATGDVIVLPTPYAFNTDPKKWAATLRAINTLGYTTLVPGHGTIQHDTAFMDLTIEALDSIAAQTEQFIADGLNQEEAGEKLDFSAFDKRFTKGDSYIDIYYQAYFVRPLRSSAYRAAKGEVMVKLERETNAEAAQD